MPQHEDLDLLRLLRTTKENEKLEQTADHPVSEAGPQAADAEYASVDPIQLKRRRLAPPSPQPERASQKRRASFWDPHVSAAQGSAHTG